MHKSAVNSNSIRESVSWFGGDSTRPSHSKCLQFPAYWSFEFFDRQNCECDEEAMSDHVLLHCADLKWKESMLASIIGSRNRAVFPPSVASVAERAGPMCKGYNFWHSNHLLYHV